MLGCVWWVVLQVAIVCLYFAFCFCFVNWVLGGCVNCVLLDFIVLGTGLLCVCVCYGVGFVGFVGDLLCILTFYCLQVAYCSGLYCILLFCRCYGLGCVCWFGLPCMFGLLALLVFCLRLSETAL